MPFRNASIHYLNHRIIVPIALTIAIAVLVLYLEPSQKATNWLLQQTQSEEGIKSLEPPPSSKFYEWQTRSQFRPISKDEAANASAQELCEYFPKHLLRDIQPVLKTGHGVLEDRVGPQLNGVSACLDNLLIFSDLEEDFMGHHIIDVIADIPLNYTIEPYEPKAAKDLAVYHAMQSLHTNGTLAEANFTAKEQWLLDRFKFLTGASRAWKMRPERRWYIFYEADTYIVWDNVFRLLEQFDPDIPWYFGAPSPGRKIGENNEITTWFANGGPGYVLSRETMRRLVSDDWDAKTGEYQGSKLIESNWDEIVKNCCGDSALSWILWQKDIKLSGLWPMFGGAPHYVPFTEMFWCKPVLTMHRPTAEEVTDLWRWQWKHRQMDVSYLSTICRCHSLILKLDAVALARPRCSVFQHHFINSA